MAADFTLNVDFDAEADALQNIANGALKQLQESMKASGVSGQTLESVMQRAAAAIAKQQKAAQESARATKSGAKGLDEMSASARDLTRDMIGAAKAAQKVKDAAGPIATALQRVGIETTAVLNRSTYEQLTAQREAGKLAAIEAQRASQEQLIAQRTAGKMQVLETQRVAQEQVIAAREGAQQRVQVTRFVLESLGRLERGFGTAVAGIARTATSVLGSAFEKMGALFRRNNQDMTSGFSSALRDRESTMRSSFRRQEMILSESVSRQERTMSRFRTLSSTGIGGALTGRGIGAGIAGVGIGYGVAATLKAGYTTAVNLGEQLNKNRVVFGSYAEDLINFFVKGAPQALGQTEAQVLEATGTFGNLFKNLGLGERDVFNFSTSLTALGSDLASFNNTPVDEALTALRAGLTGESEPLKKFGIDVSDAALKHEAMLLGISDGKSVLDAATKAQAAYSVIIKSAGDAQYDFARTAGEGANAARIRKASIDQLAATIMGYFVPAVTAANVVIGKMADNLAKFVSGDVGDGLKTLRVGLIGAAAGLGALLAAKAGVEVVQLLGATVSAALTPIGALIIAAAGIGAALAIAWKRSADFRDGVSALGMRLRELLGVAGGGLGPVLASIGAVIEGTVIPAFDRAASFVGRNLVGAFNAAYGFVTNTLIPGFAAAGRFIATTFAPIIVRAAQSVAAAVAIAVGAVSRFASRALPYIQPAIDGFKDLASAIGDAFGGDFGNLGAGVGSLAAGIVAAAGRIGSLVLSVLAPIGARVWSFLTGVFSSANLMKLASGFLDLVEQIGYILGRIASDPRLLAALAGIAAAAAIVALRFAKGFVEGVLHNIPPLLSGIGGLLAKALGAAIADPGTLARIIMAAFLAIKIGAPLIQLFQGFGRESAAAFAQGMKMKASNAAGFTQGLFGAVNPNSASASGGFFKQQAIEVSRLQAQLRSLGSTMTVAMNPTSMEAARAKVKELSRGLTDAQMKGLLVRDSFQQGFKAISMGAAGVVGGLRAIAHWSNPKLVFDAFKGMDAESGAGPGLFDRLKASAVRAFDFIRSTAKVAFGGVGEGLGMVASAARSQFDGIALRAMYAWDGIKETSSIAFGGVAQGLRTVASAASGAFQGLAARGRVAFDKIKQTFSDIVSVTAESKPVQMGKLYAYSVGIGFRTGSAAIREAVSSTLESLREVANASGMKLGAFVGAGLLSALGGYMAGKAEGSAGGSGIMSAITSGLSAGLMTGNVAIGAVAAGASLLGTAIGKSAKAAKDAKARIEGYATAIKDNMQKALEDGTVAALTFADALSGKGGENSVITKMVQDLAPVIPVLNSMGIGVNDVVDAFRRGGTAVDDLVRKASGLGAGQYGALSEAGRALLDQYNEIGAAIASIEATDIFTRGAAPAAGRGVEDPLGQVEQATRRATEAQQAHTSAVEQYVRSRMAAHQADIDEAHDTAMQEMLDRQAGALDRVTAAADKAKAAIDRAFGVDSASSFQATIDAGVLAMQDSFNQLKVGGDAGIFDEAKVRTQLDSLKQNLADAAQALVLDADHLLTQDEINAALQPLLAAALDGVDDQGLRDQITTAFNDGIANVTPLLTQQQIDDLSAGLDETGLSVPVKVDAEQAATEVHDAFHTASVNSGATSAGRVPGTQFASGMAAGIGAGQAWITAAAARAAIAAKVTVQRTLDSHSPSRVMHAIGEDVAQGLANGIDASVDLVEGAAERLAHGVVAAVQPITDNPMRGHVIIAAVNDVVEKPQPSTWAPVGAAIGQAIVDGIDSKADDIAGAASSAAQQAIDKMRFGGDQVKQGTLAGLSTLFQGVTGSDSVGIRGLSTLVGADTLGSITSATDSFLSGFDSNVSRIFEVNAKKLSDLTAADRQVYGTNVFSLDASTTFGASNVSAISGVLDNIASFADDLIRQGTPLETVAATIHNQVEDFVKLATNLGFSEDQIRALVDALGLSDAAVQDFIKSSTDLTTSLQNPPTPKEEEKKAEDPAVAPLGNLPRTITNYIVVPYGDPNAIALTVSNQQAYDARIP